MSIDILLDEVHRRHVSPDADPTLEKSLPHLLRDGCRAGDTLAVPRRTIFHVAPALGTSHAEWFLELDRGPRHGAPHKPVMGVADDPNVLRRSVLRRRL